VFKLLHELWGDAKDSTPYDHQQKLKWTALLEELEHPRRSGLAHVLA